MERWDYFLNGWHPAWLGPAGKSCVAPIAQYAKSLWFIVSGPWQLHTRNGLLACQRFHRVLHQLRPEVHENVREEVIAVRQILSYVSGVSISRLRLMRKWKDGILPTWASSRSALACQPFSLILSVAKSTIVWSRSLHMTVMSFSSRLLPSIKRAVMTPAPQALSRITDPAGWVVNRPQLDSRAWAGGPVAVSAAYWAVQGV